MQYEAPITVDTDDTSSQFGKITLHDVGGNIIEIQTPTRRGFKFLGWRFTFIDKGNEMEMNPAPNMMPGHDVIATPIWQINQKADYTIIFWKQKSVVSTAEMNKFPTDSTTYEQYIRNYNYDSSRKISQGADVDTQTSQLIAKHQNDGTFSNYINQSPDPKVSYQYKSAVASDERLRVDGSTVINVFYNRPVITYTVDWLGFSVPSDNSHRSSYTGLQGANIADYYPGFQFDTRYSWRYYESGTGYITNTLIDSFVSIEDGTAFEARTNSNTYNSKVIHFVENAEGNFEVKAEVNLSGSNNFDVTNKFDGYTAKGYRIIARRTNETISAYETRCRVPDVTSSGYRTTNMKNISVGNNRSIQVYHYRDVGYTLEMYAGTATRSDVMLAQYGSATSADIHYGDNVWSTLQKYLESQGVTVGDEPVVKPEKVQNDNTDSDTTNDWTWKGWYMVPNPQSDDTEGRLTQETAATFGDSKTVRIFAVWEAPQCTIRFHDLSNTNPVHELSYNKYSYVSPSDLYDGEQLTKPSIANTLEGTDAAFEFEGWYYDENFSAKYDTDREINRSFDLYARWLLKGRISYKVDIYNTKGEKIGTQTIMVSDAGTYETIGLEQIEGYENTGASKKIYVDADLIEAEVRAYIQDNVGVYQIHCIEDDDNMTEIRNVFLGTTYEEKYVLPPAIEGYMFTGYSRKVTTYDEGHLESKAYQVINKEQDCKSTGAGYLNTPEIIFHYKRIAGNPIEIHYFTENDLGTYTQREEDTIHLSGDAGETINYRNYQKLNEDGTTSSVDYARDDKYPGYYMAVANADLIKTVSSITSRNIVNVYYRRKFCKVEFVNRESNRSMRLTTSPNNPISKITESVKANDTVETPEVFAPVENTFYNQKYTATWYLDGTNTPFDFETPIDHDIVLYAVWGTSSNPWYTLNISGASDTVDYTASAHYITDRKSAISEVITGIKFTYNFSPNGLFAQSGVVVREATQTSLEWDATDSSKFIYQGTYNNNDNETYIVRIVGYYQGEDDRLLGGTDAGKYLGKIKIESVQQRKANNGNWTSVINDTTIKTTPGYLQIYPAKLLIKTDSLEENYNGQEHEKKSGEATITYNIKVVEDGTEKQIPQEKHVTLSADENEGDTWEASLLERDKMQYTITGKIKHTGVAENTIAIGLIHREGETENVEKNYDITYQIGRLIVKQSNEDWTPSGIRITSVDAEVDGGRYSIQVEDTEEHDYRFQVEYDGRVYRYLTHNPQFTTAGYREMKVIVSDPNYSTPKIIELDKNGEKIHVNLYQYGDVIPSGLNLDGLPYIIAIIFSFILFGAVVMFKTKNRERSGSNKIFFWR